MLMPNAAKIRLDALAEICSLNAEKWKCRRPLRSSVLADDNIHAFVSPIHYQSVVTSSVASSSISPFSSSSDSRFQTYPHSSNSSSSSSCSTYHLSLKNAAPVEADRQSVEAHAVARPSLVPSVNLAVGLIVPLPSGSSQCHRGRGQNEWALASKALDRVGSVRL